MPIEIEDHTVPHFKATINAKVEPGGLECDFDMHTIVASNAPDNKTLDSNINI